MKAATLPESRARCTRVGVAARLRPEILLAVIAVMFGGCGKRDAADEPPAPLPSPSMLPATTVVAQNHDGAAADGGGDPARAEGIDVALAALVSVDAASKPALDVLSGLGFAGKDLEGTGRTVRNATRSMHELDGDFEIESIVEITVAAIASPTSRSTELYVAWLDRAGGTLKPIGQKHFILRTCSYDASFTLSTQRVHAAAFDDTVIEWEAITTCDGHAGSIGTAVWTIARGKAEELLSLEDAFVFAPGSGRVLDPKAVLRIDGEGAPKTVALVEDEKVKKQLSFDPATFRYR